jgi:hypothetical protein
MSITVTAIFILYARMSSVVVVFFLFLLMNDGQDDGDDLLSRCVNGFAASFENSLDFLSASMTEKG